MALFLSTMQLVAALSDATRPANVLGPANAPVTIEFFSDLQCPQCARYEPIVKSLKTEFGDKVRMVLRRCRGSSKPGQVLANGRSSLQDAMDVGQRSGTAHDLHGPG